MQKGRRNGLIIGLLAAVFAACSGEGSTAVEGELKEVLKESTSAQARIMDLRARFRWAAPERPVGDALRAPLTVGPAAPVPVIGAEAVEVFEPLESGRVRVRVRESARRGVSKAARVELPARAGGPVHLEDETSGMVIDFALEGARDAEIAFAAGIALYPAALPGGVDVAHRVHAEGTEDYVIFERKPDREELVYRVDVSRAAGLRLVADVLEFLDGEGTPRVRMAPPYVVDAGGKGHAAHVMVSGCAHDADPRAPWGRTVTPPGASQCTLRMTWDDVAYPAVVDPAWVTTGSMSNLRYFHTASVLLDGRVLVAGGAGKSAELYDPATSTWAAAGNMIVPHSEHTATLLPDGRVLVVGGSNTELYVPVTNTWTPAASMATKRVHHTATLLPNGKILVAGGDDNSTALSSAELYEPSTNTWTPAGSMIAERIHHTATLLPNGMVLVAGGDINGPGASAELYNFSTDTWEYTGSTAFYHDFHTASILPSSGKVLIAGGDDGSGDLTVSAEIYDPVTKTWSTVASMAVGRARHTASVLFNGDILIAGGSNQFPFLYDSLSSTELYHPGTNTWSAAGDMTTSRLAHTASVLMNGVVLVAGGGDSIALPLSSAELYLLETGSQCTSSTDCQSDFCADGVCCDSACGGACDVCTTALGASANGVCTILPVGSIGTPPCAPLVCNGTNPTCSLCISDLECTGNQYCGSDGTCKPKKLKGALCNPAAGGDCWQSGCAVCATGFCADGICCETACNAGPCDACSIAAGASSDGTCEPFTGTPCSDSDACTQTDTCQAGICTGGNPVVCAAMDQCHNPGICDPASGTCPNPIKQDGSSCDDGNACTKNDTCQAGICTNGPHVVCSPLDQCHSPGTCDPASGICTNPPEPDGSACFNGICKGGVCTWKSGSSSTTSSSSSNTGTGTSTNSSSGAGGSGGKENDASGRDATNFYACTTPPRAPRSSPSPIALLTTLLLLTAARRRTLRGLRDEGGG